MTDSFSEKTRRHLAGRVGYRCSLCQCDTTGPMKGDALKAFSVGFAGHITAASPGGPRYDESLTSEDRRSVANGIWVCGNCHPEVDSDTSHYTREELMRRKLEAERRQEERYSSRQDDPNSFVIYCDASPLGVASWVRTEAGEVLSASIVDPEADRVNYYEGSAYVLRTLIRKRAELETVVLSSVSCIVESVAGVPPFQILFGAYPTEVSLLYVEVDHPDVVGRNRFECLSQFHITGKCESERTAFSPIVLDIDEWTTLDVRINALTEGLYTLSLELTTQHDGEVRTETLRRRENVLFLMPQFS